MYGKWFDSVYEGSMAGSGPIVLAVWGYCCAKADPEDHTVLLNPSVLVAKIGKITEAEVRSAIEFLLSPDPDSQCKDHEGRRLLHSGGLRYFVVTHERYRGMRSEEDRRHYMRKYMRDYRADVNKNVYTDLPRANPASAYASSSASEESSSEKEGVVGGKPARPKKASIIPDYSPEFDAFWQAYPRREAKKTAWESWKAALASGVDAQKIITGSNRYATACRDRSTPIDKTKLPATWLNNACWDDEYAPYVPPLQRAPRRERFEGRD